MADLGGIFCSPLRFSYDVRPAGGRDSRACLVTAVAQSGMKTNVDLTHATSSPLVPFNIKLPDLLSPNP
jgi:hypothetical protein